LAGGDSTQGVEVLENAQVRRLQVLEVLACGDEGLFDVVAGKAG
jgi:hypothetical protein